MLAFSGTDANQNITVPETQTLREEEQKEQVEAEIAACGWTHLFWALSEEVGWAEMNQALWPRPLQR